MSDKLEKPHTVEPCEANRVKLANMAAEFEAQMLAAGVVGVIALVLPGNAEMLVQLNAPWSALEFREDSVTAKVDTSDEQKSNGLNVLSILSQLTSNCGEDFHGAFTAFAKAFGVEVTFDELKHTHNKRKPH